MWCWCRHPRRCGWIRGWLRCCCWRGGLRRGCRRCCLRRCAWLRVDIRRRSRRFWARGRDRCCPKHLSHLSHLLQISCNLIPAKSKKDHGYENSNHGLHRFDSRCLYESLLVRKGVYKHDRQLYTHIKGARVCHISRRGSPT